MRFAEDHKLGLHHPLTENANPACSLCEAERLGLRLNPADELNSMREQLDDAVDRLGTVSEAADSLLQALHGCHLSRIVMNRRDALELVLESTDG